MINELWEWFIIGLVIAGISAGIVMLVIYIYLFTACCFIADKLAIALFSLRTLQVTLSRVCFFNSAYPQKEHLFQSRKSEAGCEFNLDI